jgi:hypothetical protein
MATRYKIAGPDIVHESFGGDLVVLNLGSGQYFGVNTSGAALWSAIVQGQDASKLGHNDAAEKAVSDFAAQLREFGLIVPDDSEESNAPSIPISLGTLPTIEAYDDLSDLIVADPIHDVDANMGWPKLPDAE